MKKLENAEFPVPAGPLPGQSWHLTPWKKNKGANVPYDLKHLVILAKKSHITELISRHYYHQVEHQGQEITLKSLRSSGYWVIEGTSVVGNLISKCVVCQSMAGLPERLEPSPAFTYCALDYFGPWLIQDGRGKLKRYGVLFTCLDYMFAWWWVHSAQGCCTVLSSRA